jgi:hypothetical protein
VRGQLAAGLVDFYFFVMYSSIKSKVRFTFYFYAYTLYMHEYPIKNRLPELRARHRITQDGLAGEL